MMMESATATARTFSAAPTRAWSWLRRNALTIYAGIATVYVLIPIAVIANATRVAATAC